MNGMVYSYEYSVEGEELCKTGQLLMHMDSSWYSVGKHMHEGLGATLQ